MKKSPKIIAGILGVVILVTAGTALAYTMTTETATSSTCASAQSSIPASVIDPNYVFDENKYKTMDQQHLLATLNMLSKHDLIQEGNAFANAFLKEEPEALMVIASTFLEPKNEFTLEETVRFLKDPQLNVGVKELLLELVTMRKISTQEQNQLKDLLKDPSVNLEIKSRLVRNFKMDQSDIALLRTLIQSDNLNLSIQSMMALSDVDAQASVDLANEILSNRLAQPREKVSWALRDKAKFIRSNNSADEESKFIELCDGIIKDQQDINLQTSAIFALSNLGSKAAIRKLLQNPLVDSGMKVASVENNFLTLKSLLTNNPTEDDIELVVLAMEVNHLTDLINDLEKGAFVVKDVTLKQRCTKVLAIMKTKGHPVNPTKTVRP